jgi:hypothetical protein
MTLTDAQKQQVAAWIEQGLKLSEIQNKLVAEFGAKFTYMEVRFLMDDLKLKPKDPEPPKAPPVPPAAAAIPASPAAGTGAGGTLDDFAPEPPAPAGGGNVKLTIDQVMRPGALVSGKVTFSDGQTAEWYLDQTGRLGLTAKNPGYRPPEADLMIFQTQLQAALAGAGF